jgi:hypothetical protein
VRAPAAACIYTETALSRSLALSLPSARTPRACSPLPRLSTQRPPEPSAAGISPPGTATPTVPADSRRTPAFVCLPRPLRPPGRTPTLYPGRGRFYRLAPRYRHLNAYLALLPLLFGLAFAPPPPPAPPATPTQHRPPALHDGRRLNVASLWNDLEYLVPRYYSVL